MHFTFDLQRSLERCITKKAWKIHQEFLQVQKYDEISLKFKDNQLFLISNTLTCQIQYLHKKAPIFALVVFHNPPIARIYRCIFITHTHVQSFVCHTCEHWRILHLYEVNTQRRNITFYFFFESFKSFSLICSE